MMICFRKMYERMQEEEIWLIDRSFSRKIYYINFIYSIVMLLHHADADVYFDNIIQTGSLMDYVAYQINLWFVETDAIYYFMMLSAFLLYHDLSKDNIKGKLKRRVKTLLIPWLVWNIIGMISYHDFDQGIAYLLRNFFASRFCPQIRYLVTLMVLLLFIPLFRRIFKIKYVREAALAVIYIIGYLGFPFIREADFFPSEQARAEVLLMLSHVPVYCFGTYLGLNYAEFVISEKYNNEYRKAAIVTAVSILVLPYIFPNSIIGYALGKLQFAAVWIILRKKYFTLHPKWWIQISFYMYVIHNFVLYWEGKIIKLSGIFSVEFNSSTVTESFALMWRFMLSAIAVPLIIISAKILLRFTPKFYAALSGGKIPNMYES